MKPNQIINYISKRQYVEKLLIEEKEVINERYIRSLKNISSTLFERDIPFEDTDMMVKKFNEYADNMIEELNGLKENYGRGNYPGENIIQEGIDLINKTRGFSKAIDVFKELFKNEDDYLDFEQDYLPIKSFFKKVNKRIFGRNHNILYPYMEKVSPIY